MRNGKIVLLFSLFVLVLTLSSFSTTDANKDAPKWKNVQVLPNNLKPEQMDEIMEAWSESLGVQCSHCHEDGNPSADVKEEKVIARKMLTMTNEINEKYFGKNSGTVSCMTCHNGKVHP